MAVVWALDQFRTMILGKTFLLETDHTALRQLLTTKDPLGRIARWVLKLQEYDMEVSYRNADYMSREATIGAPLVNLVQISSSTPGKKNAAWNEIHQEIS